MLFILCNILYNTYFIKKQIVFNKINKLYLLTDIKYDYMIRLKLAIIKRSRDIF